MKKENLNGKNSKVHGTFVFFKESHICHLKYLKNLWAKTEFLLFIVSKVSNEFIVQLHPFPNTTKSHRLQALYTWLTDYEITCRYWLMEEQYTTLITKHNFLAKSSIEIEILEKCVKYVQSTNKEKRILNIILVPLLLTLIKFQTFF